MICKKCKKEIDDNSKFCGYCGKKIKKSKINSKFTMCVLILTFIIVVSSIILLMINLNKNTAYESENTLYSLSELKFLKEINTNEIFTILDNSVNDELIGTYAFISKKNITDGSNQIVALKKDNTIVEILNIPYDGWNKEINYIYYNNGNLYYDIQDTRWSVSLTEGNGNYNPINYEFISNYELDWFYVLYNKVYMLSDDSCQLEICDLTTKDCQYQVIDKRQKDEIIIDGKEIDIDFNSVYVEEDKFIYIMTEDKKNIYKIDVNNPVEDLGLTLASYTKVNKVGKNAMLLSDLNKLTYNDIKLNYEDVFFIEYKGNKYNLKENNYRPITLLPNNYLMVEYYGDEESYYGETKYINLKTGLIDENYNLEVTQFYGDTIYFINNKVLTKE